MAMGMPLCWMKSTMRSKGLINGLRRSLFEFPCQAAHQALSLADDHMICFELVRRYAAGNGATHHGPQAARPAALDDGRERLALNVHCAQQHHVGPGQVTVAERLDVRVHQPFIPGFGQQRDHRHQPQRRLCGPLAQKLERVFETPEGIGKFRVDQEGVHRLLLQEQVRRAHKSAEGATVGSSASRNNAVALRRTSSEIVSPAWPGKTVQKRSLFGERASFSDLRLSWRWISQRHGVSGCFTKRYGVQ